MHFGGRQVSPKHLLRTPLSITVCRYFPGLKNGHSIWTIPLHTRPPLYTDVELTPAPALLLDAKGSRLLPAGAVAGDGPWLGCAPTAPASGLELLIFTETRPALPGTQTLETLPKMMTGNHRLGVTVFLCCSKNGPEPPNRKYS